MSDPRTHAAEIEEFLRGLDARESELFDAERRITSAALRAPVLPERILQAAEHALASGEARRRHHLAVVVPERAAACHAGCSWCCHHTVPVTAPEILFLAEHLTRAMPSPDLARIKTRAAELARDPRIFASDERAAARIPCVLLTDAGACGAYEARPLTCRGYDSTDAESCRRGLDDDSEPPLTNVQLGRDCAAVGLGLLAAVGEAGLPREMLELTVALHIALSDPNAHARWLAGEAVFAPASLIS